MRQTLPFLVLGVSGLMACTTDDHGAGERLPAPPPARTAVVRDTVLTALLTGSGTAEPFMRATLSTRLMATVTSVEVREGATVRAGQVLARLDMRDLEARRSQVAAARTAAEAAWREAELNLARMQALYADSAAARVQLDAAVSGHAQAEAAVQAARAAAAEVEASAAYGRIEAPFDGRVVQRFVDPGAFVAPGAPILTVEDASRLRVSAALPPEAARALAPGDSVAVRVESIRRRGRVEGVIPVPGRGLWEVNVVLANGDGTLTSGGAATVEVPVGERPGVVVPEEALVAEGDLVGVEVVTEAGQTRRWLRVGESRDGLVEVLSGLRPGEVVALPAVAGAER